ncbi:Bax inhibitor-1/YccA family protein [Actinoalloteichus hymeniacidonis]|uniref:Membrane protein n=1 Tax=Actinoalloteichus hymeniacidonis TaxID=340345 RepID=A0AAC9HLX5_9PSEU|nr:Bax inhibitor-1/YccA family protein [Actinoalloteichus hymeniacidonis]AOS61601.1 putative membrane protein [Actinoalloteichus hymeniacidonis]MBB5910389.1 putative YccA/Bax inhibitor family protein [Actinoalloteichus hymeniacidonis]
MRTTSNPAFRNLPSGGGYANFDGYGQPQGYGQQQGPPVVADRPMTIDDVVTKTGMTLGVLVITAVLTALSGAYFLAIPGLIAGLILGFVNAFKRKPSPVLILLYAVAEGMLFGALSGLVASFAPGGGAIVSQAVVGTIGVFAGMLVVYKTGAIRVTPKLTRWIFGAMIGVVVLMLANLVAGFFVPGGMGLRDGSTMAIIFSLVCIGIAAFVFLLDFKAADDMIQQGTPSVYAWQVAFGLTVTLVWLYIEILRLLSYFNE